MTQLFKKIRIDNQQALSIQQPLIRSTLANIFKHGTARSLTGPIARGDESTIALHLAVLRRSMPAMLPLYCSLGRQTVSLALEKKSISAKKAGRIIGLLGRERRSA